MVILFIKIKARPKKRKELSQTLQSIVQQVGKERGCLHCGYYRDVEKENDFLILEEWANPKYSDAHLRSDIFTVLIGAGGLMQQPPEIAIHTVSRSTDCEARTPKPNSKI